MNNLFIGMEKLSLVDFEGKVACTLFTNGCNFRCHFCHNSDLVILKENACYKYLEDNEIFSYLEKRKKQLDAVVITGGEPTLMPNLEEKLKKIKELGYLIKLDTNGSNFEKLKKFVDEGLIDYVAMDVKNSLEDYCNTINVNSVSIMDNVKKSIEFLKNDNIDYEFRTTIVEELHNEKNIEEMGKLLKGAKRLYLQKFVNNNNCINNNLHKVPLKKALEFKCLLEKYLSNVNLRGY